MSEQFKNMDNLIRDKFENFEVKPPDHVWDNIQSSIGNGRTGGIFKTGGIAGLSIILISLGLISLYLINNAFKSKETETTISQNYSEPNDKSATGLLAINSSETISENTESSEEIKVPRDKSKKEVKSAKKSRESKKSTKNGAIFIEPNLTSLPTKENRAQTSLVVIDRIHLSRPLAVAPVTEKQIKSKQTNPAVQNTNSQELNLTQTDKNNDLIRGKNVNSEGGNVGAPKQKNDYNLAENWQMGLFFTPEMIKYNSDNQLTNYSYSIDLQAIYKTNHLLFQSGLGLAQVTDKGNNRIDFHKYLGSYEDVYDITFDTTGTGLDPIFHTQTVYVFDTLNSVKISPTKRKFTYLQIPFLAGYGKEFRRFGWFIKAGPSLSLLINENKGLTGSGSEQDKVINVDNELPGRIQTNWQFIISGGASVKMGKNLSFSIEPMFRYYLQSAYEHNQLNTRHPYSIGLRSGLLLHF